MRGKRLYINFLKILRLFVLPVVLMLVLSPLVALINLMIGVYFFITGIFILLIYYFFMLTLYPMKKGSNTLFCWLDRLHGGQTFLMNLFEQEETKDDLQYNLESVFKKLLVFSKHNIKNLKLLRAYFRTLNNENAFDMFSRTIITALVSIAISFLTKGAVIDSINEKLTIVNLHINSTYISVLSIGSIGIILIIWLAYMVLDYHQNKKRNRIILEILEVCIEEVKNN